MRAVQVLPNGKIFCDRLIRFIQAAWAQPNSHHHVPPKLLADLLWWRNFLPNWTGKKVLRTAAEEKWEDIGLFTDASGELGAGGMLGKDKDAHWWACTWSPDFQSNNNGIDIFWKEMLAIWVSIALWSTILSNRRIILHCDNMACV